MTASIVSAQLTMISEPLDFRTLIIICPTSTTSCQSAPPSFSSVYRALCSAFAVGIRSSVYSIICPRYSRAIMVYTREDLLIEISQRLRVMRTQEVSQYVVPDYLAEEWQQKLRDATGPCEDRDHPPAAAVPSSSSAASLGDGDSSSIAALASPSSSQINEVWREMLCEWCYQIVDHFGEIIIV